MTKSKQRQWADSAPRMNSSDLFEPVTRRLTELALWKPSESCLVTVEIIHESGNRRVILYTTHYRECQRKRKVTARGQMVADRSKFGYRWWFECLTCRKKVKFLYLKSEAETPVCRECCQLGYSKQKQAS